jgi:hypothetical protein
MAVASGKGMASDGFTFGGGTVVLIVSMWAWTYGKIEGAPAKTSMVITHV